MPSTSKYFVHGACRNGEDCPFSHDFSKGQDMVCKYYLRGACSFGAQCRYDHIRPERLGRGLEPAPRAGGPSSSYIPPPDAPAVPSTSTWTATAAGGGGGGGGNDQQHEDQYVDNGEHEAEHDEEAVVNAMHAMRLATQHDDLLATLPDTIDDDDDVFYHGDSAYTHQEYGEYEHGALTNNIPVNPWENNTHGASTTAEGSVWGGPLPAHLKATPTSSSSPPSVLPPSAVNRIPAAALHGLCPEWFVAGRCQRGGACTLVHGNQCEICNKWALHPADKAHAAQHTSECTERHQRLAARRSAARLECCVCLEVVLSKTNPRDRKFGLLSGCDHVFCLSCIRNWRSNAEDEKLDTTGAVRACPICRSLSYFVTPSTSWPTSAEEKSTIINAYKAHLATIDCKHFDHGNGYCPFSTSCFYRHVLADGTEPPARHATGRAQPPLTLGDFLDVRTVQRRLR